MTNKIALIAVCIFFVACSSQKTNRGTALSATDQSSKELKVMVWNIWHGGKDESLPADGRPDIIKLIKQTGADVILMIETYGSAPMIAEALGFHYELLSSNLCIYSRYPIAKKLLFPDQIAAFNFGGVEILVEDKPILVFDTWLHYLPDTRLAPIHKSEAEIIAWENAGTRDDEIKAILKAITPYLHDSDNVPIIMGGDFNSHSHLDWVESTKDQYNHGQAVVEWAISKAMEDAGFEDTFRQARPDPLKDIGTTWLGVRDESGKLSYTRRDRIDYLYSQGKSLSVKASEAVVAPVGKAFAYNNRAYDFFPSDHGFVLTTFQLK